MQRTGRLLALPEAGSVREMIHSRHKQDGVMLRTGDGEVLQFWVPVGNVTIRLNDRAGPFWPTNL